MASGRMIQRDLLEQKAWGKLSPWARLLWQGLVLIADDQGRCIGNLPVVRSKVFPWDDLTLKEIDAALTELVQVKFVLRYTIGEDEYLQLLTWWEHQQMQYARPSAYPAPEGWQDRLRYNHSGKYIESNWREQTEPAVESPMPPVSPVPEPPAYLDSVGSAPTYTPHLDPLNLNELNLNLNQNNLNQLNSSSSSSLTRPISDAQEEEQEVQNLPSAIQKSKKPEKPTQTDLPPEIAELLRAGGVFPALWHEVKTALESGYDTKDLAALMDWARDDNPDTPAALFVTRLRQGGRAPAQYATSKCEHCGERGNHRRDCPERLRLSFQLRNDDADDADATAPVDCPSSAILPPALQTALTRALKQLHLPPDSARVVTFSDTYNQLHLCFDTPLELLQPHLAAGERIEDALSKRMTRQLAEGQMVSVILQTESPPREPVIAQEVAVEVVDGWQAVLNQLRSSLSKPAFETWVADTTPLTYTNGTLTIHARNTYAVEWLTDRLTEPVSRLLPAVFGQPVTVQFVAR